jgi:hypothetical protein
MMTGTQGASQLADGILADANRRLESPAQWEQLTALLVSLRPLAGQAGAAFPLEPAPFTTRGAAVLPEAAAQLQFRSTGELRGQAALGNMVKQMDSLIAALEPRSASISASRQARTTPMASSANWGSIDSMMAQAEQLAMSDKPSDQLKAQKLMMQAKQMFETVSKLMQQLAEMAKTAISNIR